MGGPEVGSYIEDQVIRQEEYQFHQPTGILTEVEPDVMVAEDSEIFLQWDDPSGSIAPDIDQLLRSLDDLQENEMLPEAPPANDLDANQNMSEQEGPIVTTQCGLLVEEQRDENASEAPIASCSTERLSYGQGSPACVNVSTPVTESPVNPLGLFMDGTKEERKEGKKSRKKAEGKEETLGGIVEQNSSMCKGDSCQEATDTTSDNEELVASHVQPSQHSTPGKGSEGQTANCQNSKHEQESEEEVRPEKRDGEADGEKLSKKEEIIPRTRPRQPAGPNIAASDSRHVEARTKPEQEEEVAQAPKEDPRTRMTSEVVQVPGEEQSAIAADGQRQPAITASSRNTGGDSEEDDGL